MAIIVKPVSDFQREIFELRYIGPVAETMEAKKDHVCRLCKQVFCCINCRRNHMSTHQDAYLPDCPLCNNKELVLRFSAIAQLFDHVAKHHLPLGCVKCNQIVESAEDLRKLDQSCILVKPSTVIPEIQILVSGPPAKAQMAEPSVEMGTQTQTPISKFNLKWSQKARNSLEGSLVRSASTAFQQTSAKVTTTRLIRSTSTPTQELMCVMQTTSHFMNGTQVSSICNASEIPVTSPVGLGLGCTPMAPKVDKFKLPLQQKLRTKGGGGSSATPLRQVISQNVQRVFLQRDFKMLLAQDSLSNCPSPGSIPLDLRTRRNLDCVDDQMVEIERAIIDDAPLLLYPENDQLVMKTPQKLRMSLESEGSPCSDIFYTPAEPPRRRSSIFSCVEMGEELRFSCTDEMPSRPDATSEQQTGLTEEDLPVEPEKKLSLWNVLSTVFRFASTNLISRFEPNQTLPEQEESISLSVKRRLTSPNTEKSPINRVKRTRIQGRPPIARMRSLE